MLLNKNLYKIGLCLTLAAVSAYGDHYDVYLLAGQSNAGGHGYVSRDYAYFSPSGDDGLVELSKTQYLIEQPDAIFFHWRGGNPSVSRPTLWEMRTNSWIPMKAGYSLYGYNSNNPESLGDEIINHPFGAEVTFAERMVQLRPGRKVAVIKYSQGATALGTTASPGAWDPTAGRTYSINTYANAGHCYAAFFQMINLALQTLQTQGHTYTIRGMFWHQGESDSGLTTEVYKNRLQEFIAAVRADLGIPNLPFVIGELIQSQSGYANVRTAQSLAAEADPTVGFASSAGLAGDSTSIHFDTNGQLTFGNRYADEMVSGTTYTYTRKLLAYWKLDETALSWNGSVYASAKDSVTDIVGILYGYTSSDAAFVNGSILNQPGPTGGADKAYNFTEPSGISGINTLRADAVPATGDFTILLWMKTSNIHTAQGHLFSNNNAQAGRANLYVENSGLKWFHNGGVSLAENSSPIFDNQWHEVGVARSGSNWYLLRDSNTVASGTTTGTISQAEWMIGRMRSYNGDYDGLVGDVKVYNYCILDKPDLDGDASVNLDDFSVLSQRWLSIDCGACSGADVTLDESVLLEDLILVTEQWLQ